MKRQYKHPFAKCRNNHVLGKRAMKARRKCCFTAMVVHYGIYTACLKYGIIHTTLDGLFKTIYGSTIQELIGNPNNWLGGSYTIPVTTPSHSVILNSLNEEKTKT